MFTREELPIGSIIQIESGYTYRPEGWVGTGGQTSRPEPTTVSKIIVDEGWWGNYDTRAFNINKNGVSDLTGQTAQARLAFKIWIPKK